MSETEGRVNNAQDTENRLRAAAAAIHEGREYDPKAVADACIEAADHIARTRPRVRYYLDVLDEDDCCPRCQATTCHHQHGCHVCKACR